MVGLVASVLAVLAPVLAVVCWAGAVEADCVVPVAPVAPVAGAGAEVVPGVVESVVGVDD